eukprot:CAMPEP_0184857828 /NCGR_PEP_ID=MMETSP0580-20130426/2980_1 /TAXON_ID=1118495 /ORGANISM="Dactyliosolen fragilissimus" /LENGTH=570 /DNA_ID=CAMNT_0027353659 /DNA_START=1 /DNA_END=1709 /DNA_ORIENTATION=-
MTLTLLTENCHGFVHSSSGHVQERLISAYTSLSPTQSLQISFSSSFKNHSPLWTRYHSSFSLHRTRLIVQVSSGKDFDTQPPSRSNKRSSKKTRQTQNDLVPEVTLYEILESTPNATRAELKKSYVRLARETHPDALLQKSLSSSSSDGGTTISTQTPHSFQDVSNAWKILSDTKERKRYDRSLRAAEFTKEVEDLMGEGIRVTGPKVREAIERVAIPFLRRSAATTIAGFTALNEDSKGGNKGDAGGRGEIGNVINRVVRAGQRVGRDIDRLELVEKSDELLERANKEESKAQKIREKLNEVVNERLNLSLNTPESGLSSLEALKLLDGFNTLDEKTFLDTMMLRNTVTSEIELLESIEAEFDGIEEKKRDDEEEFSRQKKALYRAKINASAAQKAVERARNALREAESLVQSANLDLSKCQMEHDILVDELERNAKEMEKLDSSLAKRRERVRIALKNKQDVVEKRKQMDNSTSDVITSNSNEITSTTTSNSSSSSLFVNKDAERINALRKEEKSLIKECTRLDEMVQRLRSRSEKILDRSKLLEMEDEAWEIVNRAKISPSPGDDNP